MRRTQPITVVQYGIGAIGAETVRLLLTKPWARIVAAVDIDPAKVGRDLGEVIGLDRKLGITVTSTLDCRADVVCHTTGSRLQEVAGQLAELMSRGFHVVSTCEELAFPTDMDVREELQHVARANQVALIGTGVNPGFIMDKLPLTATAVCQEVRSVSITRVQNASDRREPAQKKIGAGLTVEEFDKAVDEGTIRHMGMRESLLMIADGLGAELDSISDELVEPVIADHTVTTEFVTVRRGDVAGVHQRIHGKGRIDIDLELKMYVGAEDEAMDRIVIRGVPEIELEIKGGVHGDRAAAAMVVNCVPRIVVARHGVLTMDDIPVSYR